MRNFLATLSLSLLGSLLAAGMAFADCDRCGHTDPCGCQTAKKHCDCRGWEKPKNHCGCASQDYCRCKSRGRNCWGGKGVWVEDGACECSIKPLDPQRVCAGDDCSCGGAHPYERCFNGSSMLCDTGCGIYLPCKRVCVNCETKVHERTFQCGCDCETDYYTTTECTELGRPRVVPWWFTGGQGNMYMEESAPALDMVQDQAGGTRLRGVAGSPEISPTAEEVTAAPAEDSTAAEGDSE